jgi:serine/threonine protein kinase
MRSVDPNKYYDVDESVILGKGGFGAVYWGVDKETQAPVAVKKMTINKRNKMEYLLIETELHAKSSHHPNIVTFLDAFLLKDLNEFWVQHTHAHTHTCNQCSLLCSTGCVRVY